MLVLLVISNVFIAFAQPLFPSQDVKFLFRNRCAECHGKKGYGAEQGPKIKGRKVIIEAKEAELEKMLLEGIKTEKSNYMKDEYKEQSPGWMMEPLKDRLTKEEITSMVELLRYWNHR